MKTHRSSTRLFISAVLTVSILLPGFVMPVSAQSRPIVITFGQPNIWSLEQAHYLLARMHRQNLDLQTAALGQLDPNATNASRIDIMKTLLQAGVSFDQAVGLNNRLLRRDKEFNSDRRRELLNNRSSLQTESTQLARDISALRVARAAATNESEQAQLQASIDAKTEQKAAVDNELAQTNDEVKGMTSASGEFQSAKVPEFSTAPLTGDLDDLINKVELVSPSLAATLRLDNHIQLQYEIISKQLTLLRDEVGPGERLVFLELPQSINATQDRAADKMAQTWWRIAGYTTIDKDMLFRIELRKLLGEIIRLDTEFKETKELTDKNATHKTSLQAKITSIGNQKASLENEIANIDRELEAIKKKQAGLQKAIAVAEKSLVAAEADLADAIKSGYRRQVTGAEREVTTAKYNLSAAQEIAADYDRAIGPRSQNLNDDLKALIESQDQVEKALTETRESIQKIEGQQDKLNKDYARTLKTFTSLSTKYEKLRLERIKKEVHEKQERVDRLLQGGGVDTTELVKEVMKLLESPSDQTKAQYADQSFKPTIASTGMRKRCNEYSTPQAAVDADCEPRSFHDLEEQNDRATGVRRRAVRTIDVIPRQNAINVQDTKQTLSRTGIFAAVSFLFGFAGKFTYERQREHAEQFLNQELFTSGFGKGEKDFGWSFFPFAGSKQLASGVRTTYAVAIIPDDAETIVLKARGCYFPRKENQPLDYRATSQPEWTTDSNRRKAMCTPTEQMFIVPVPGGSGDGADFYVTGIHYSPFQAPGTRMVASIEGQNLPSQVGVLIDGVPLREAIGLGQLNIESILENDKTKDNCVGKICGRFERIDANEIVISFNSGSDFEGTPRITLIGPGRSIELNKLNLTINGEDDAQLMLTDSMFGSPPDPTLRRIADFKVAPVPPVPAASPSPALPLPGREMRGVLTGSKFKPSDKIFVNGTETYPTSTCRRDLCIVEFTPQDTDYLTVTISPTSGDEKAVSKTFVNPKTLSIISASVVNFVPAEGSQPAVLTVKLDGSGFKEDLRLTITKSVGDPDVPQIIVPSAGQMFLKITNPEAVVQINVVDPANNRVVRAIVVRP